MSKWVDESSFKNFRNKKKNEEENKNRDENSRLDVVWKTPEKGTTDKPKVYEVRFMANPDPGSDPYMMYLYHMFQFSSGDGWHFSLCPKTYDMSNYCPWCSIVSKLYATGNKSDNKIAYRYKRKPRYCGDIFIINDPRDAEIDNEENKATGKVKVYEFPGKVESKLKTEITDERNGLGHLIFDPGEEGYNFIIRVASTIPDKNSKVFPEYSNSAFARRPSSIGTEEEIEKIMDQRYSLSEHIKKMEVPEDKIIEAIKKEMVWDLIEDEYEKITGASLQREETETKEETQEEKKPESDSFESDDNLSESDLLKELEQMGME